MAQAGAVITTVILMVSFGGYFYAADKMYPGCGGCGTVDYQRKLIYWIGFLTAIVAFWTSVNFTPN